MPNGHGQLEGKVAFVTGAANGQGRAHAVRLAEEGADIIAVDLCGEIASSFVPASSSDELAQTAAEIESLGRLVKTYEADVRDFMGLSSAVMSATAEFGRLDIVVANAGIISAAPSIELTEQQWQDVIDVNLTGVWHTIKVAVPIIQDNGRGGSIIIISSTAGIKGLGNLSHYCAAKHGVIGLGLSLAVELASDMIRVNCVCPGLVNTRMNDNPLMIKLVRPELDNPTWEDSAEVLAKSNLLPVRWLEPRDVSEAVLWLASDVSRSVTGVTLPVDLGVLVK
jgi:(+)-trans-carveol dehydrogenase